VDGRLLSIQIGSGSISAFDRLILANEQLAGFDVDFVAVNGFDHRTREGCIAAS
jgi:hypothetical protein